MKKFSLLLFLIPLITFPQDFTKVDNVTRAAYKKVTTIDALAERINNDFETDIEKVRSVFTWLTFNVSYRLHYSKTLEAPEFFVYLNDEDLEKVLIAKEEKKITDAFYNRQAVCEGYSLLFKRICDLLKIENEMVFGYTKASGDYVGVIPKGKNHVWNAVKVNNKWMMIDATYGAGYISKNIWIKKFNDTFFDAKKKVLNGTHYPGDPKWRRFLGQKELREFCQDPVVKSAYFKHNLDVLEPKQGVIDLKNKSHLKFKIKGLKHMQSLLYVYGKEGMIRTPEVSGKKEYRDYYFKKPKEDTTLHIYVDNELALEYIVKVE
ncbi:transglutaminase domain-containing protein [uncultured Tenacibaculum sp.]|uniref:transglutaminase domain-containing protein n=1 Tax=uncultured Tenacibaculum sp. TaxID=174713 RepID=UPI00262770F4|nr:transglutaminase domain-containing protein [uncultured Tenacibaculum sp.]